MASSKKFLNTVVASVLLAAMLVSDGGTILATHQNGQAEKPRVAPTETQQNRRAERSVEILSLIASVRSAPAEFACDLLIAIAESAKVSDIDWKKQLLEDAFTVAGDCEHKMPQKAVGPYPVDTRAGYLAEAFRLKLDTLSLRCRIIESMLRWDKRKALELFRDIGDLRFSTINCESGLVPDLSEFYKIASKLYQDGFTPADIKKGDNIRFVETLIFDLSSPVQVPTLGNMIRSLALTREERQRLVDALSSKISTLSGDDRSFSSSSYFTDDELARLIHSCDEQGVSSTELIRSLRLYYVRQFSSARCADTLRNPGDTGIVPIEIARFNKRVRQLKEGTVPEIDSEEIRPARLDHKVDVHFYWQTPRSAELMRMFKNLRFGASLKPLAASDMDNDKWKSDFGVFLEKLRRWSKDDEQAVEDYFHQKCVLFEALSSIPLESDKREEINSEFLRFLAQAELKGLSQIEWFWHAKNLLPAHSGGTNLKQWTVLESSNNLVLHLYAIVQKTINSSSRIGKDPTQRFTTIR